MDTGAVGLPVMTMEKVRMTEATSAQASCTQKPITPRRRKYLAVLSTRREACRTGEAEGLLSCYIAKTGERAFQMLLQANIGHAVTFDITFWDKRVHLSVILTNSQLCRQFVFYWGVKSLLSILCTHQLHARTAGHHAY